MAIQQKELKTAKAEYRSVPCPTCQAEAGRRCVTPYLGSTRPIDIIHFAREREYSNKKK